MPPKLKRISQYVLGKTLGQGTFGKVKYAVDTNTNTPVALKIMDKAKIKSAKIGPQIKKEIKVLKMLNHQTCIKLIEVLASEENIFLVMELVSGGELFDRVVANGRFSENEARRYFAQLIDGLEHCHQFGVCHRDLKPENLLLDAHGGLKITDFGLASINEKLEDGLQILHTPCGTPNYVAPEVLMEKGYDGTLADVWSAGVILYLLVSGFLPFDEPQMVDLFRKIVVADYQYPSWLSHEVQQLISQMLEPNVDRRATIQQIKDSPWFRCETSSSRRKKLAADSNLDSPEGNIDDQDDMSHIVDMDIDHMMFGTQPFTTTLSPDEFLLLHRSHLSTSPSQETNNGCINVNCSHNPYTTQLDPITGLEKIFLNGEWRDVREWFYEKYPGKRSVIDENVRREKRAARRAAQAQAALAASQGQLDPSAVLSNPSLSVLGSSSQHQLNNSTLGANESTSTLFPTTNTLTPQSSAIPNSSATSDNSDFNNQNIEDDEPGTIAPKQLNAFDLINMVSGQSVNNMLLFNSGQNESNSPSSTGTSAHIHTLAGSPGGMTPLTTSTSIQSTSKAGITTSIEGENAQYKDQLRQTQMQHQQQSFTQFTCKCPTSLLIKRLDYVLLHLPHVKYRINYKKCYINVVWTNIRNSHQVHEFIEVYSLANDLHMVRCQRVSGSVIAHGEFYKIFKDNIKYLETHTGVPVVGSLSAPIPEGNSEIVVATPSKPRKPTSPQSQQAPNSIIITEEDIDNYILDWSQDVLIYRDYAMKRHHLMQLKQQELGGDIKPVDDDPIHPDSKRKIPLSNPAASTTSVPAPNLTNEQLERGLNTFRSLTLNSKSVTTRPRGTSAAPNPNHGTAAAASPTNQDVAAFLQTDGKLMTKQPSSSSDDDDDDDDDSSSSEEDTPE